MKQLIIFICISFQIGQGSLCLPTQSAPDCLAPAIKIAGQNIAAGFSITEEKRAEHKTSSPVALLRDWTKRLNYMRQKVAKRSRQTLNWSQRFVAVERLVLSLREKQEGIYLSTKDAGLWELLNYQIFELDRSLSAMETHAEYSELKRLQDVRSQFKQKIEGFKIEIDRLARQLLVQQSV